MKGTAPPAGQSTRLETIAGIPPWSILHLESVSSTSDYLRDNLIRLGSRTVVYADRQTSGRGRHGRRWASPEGGLYASLLLKPPPPVELAPRVSLLVADLICDLLREVGTTAHIKWPNDVLVENRKIAGILPEYGSHPEPWFIIGFGMNTGPLPVVEDGRGLEPTSWMSFSNPPDTFSLLAEILWLIDSAWPDHSRDPLAPRLESINSRLWSRGAIVRLTRGVETATGTMTGVTPEGHLRLTTINGTKVFDSGELRPL